jgi:hypothetical protein
MHFSRRVVRPQKTQFQLQFCDKCTLSQVYHYPATVSFTLSTITESEMGVSLVVDLRLTSVLTGRVLAMYLLIFIIYFYVSRDSAVGIATAYGLDD